MLSSFGKSFSVGSCQVRKACQLLHMINAGATTLGAADESLENGARDLLGVTGFGG